jgi:hypothetical protein
MNRSTMSELTIEERVARLEGLHADDIAKLEAHAAAEAAPDPEAVPEPGAPVPLDQVPDLSGGWVQPPGPDEVVADVPLAAPLGEPVGIEPVSPSAGDEEPPGWFRRWLGSQTS